MTAESIPKVVHVRRGKMHTEMGECLCWVQKQGDAGTVFRASASKQAVAVVAAAVVAAAVPAGRHKAEIRGYSKKCCLENPGPCVQVAGLADIIYRHG